MDLSPWRLITHDIAIDLGTANTLLALRGQGVVIQEPSVIAKEAASNKILAVGNKAQIMVGRTGSDTATIRPLRDGVIADFEGAEGLITELLAQVHRDFNRLFTLSRPRVVVGVPSLINEVEAMAVIDVIRAAGARRVYVVLEPVLAALGAGLPLNEPTGSMVIDIGGGTTDIAIVSLGSIVVDRTIRIAGDEMTEAIADYARHKYNLVISTGLAEAAKMEIGTVTPSRKQTSFELTGRDAATGLPKRTQISGVELAESLLPIVERIAHAAHDAIQHAPAEIVSDLMREGIVITGGGALLGGVAEVLEKKLQVPVRIAPNPLTTVVQGAYCLLDNPRLLTRLEQQNIAYQ